MVVRLYDRSEVMPLFIEFTMKLHLIWDEYITEIFHSNTSSEFVPREFTEVSVTVLISYKKMIYGLISDRAEHYQLSYPSVCRNIQGIALINFTAALKSLWIVLYYEIAIIIVYFNKFGMYKKVIRESSMLRM